VGWLHAGMRAAALQATWSSTSAIACWQNVLGACVHMDEFGTSAHLRCVGLWPLSLRRLLTRSRLE
jgi:hypothetical protein